MVLTHSFQCRCGQLRIELPAGNVERHWCDAPCTFQCPQCWKSLDFRWSVVGRKVCAGLEVVRHMHIDILNGEWIGTNTECKRYSLYIFSFNTVRYPVSFNIWIFCRTVLTSFDQIRLVSLLVFGSFGGCFHGRHRGREDGGDGGMVAKNAPPIHVAFLKLP